jgi:ABC-type glycerol-3-phosphate transport system permease component
MIVGSDRHRRATMAVRYGFLVAAAVVLVLPFTYMVSTSLKTRSLVLEYPPSADPR